MSKIYLYNNGTPKNHGCEAITRATCSILAKDKEEIILESFDYESELHYGIQKLCTIVDCGKHIRAGVFIRATNKALRFITKNNNFQYRRQYGPVIRNIEPNSLALSVGGDNLCYHNSLPVQNYLNSELCKKNVRNVLWGCSIDPEVIFSDEGKVVLNMYDLIVARESMTYRALKDAGIKGKVVLYPDPAFQLEKKVVQLPYGFVPDKTVGINLSPLIMNYESNSIAYASYIKLIHYLLGTTDFSILLIPHVVADSIVLKMIEKEIDSKRIVLVDDCTCEELKGIISQCRFFIGARTHATIAAYSTGVPTLVSGYSIKAKGIAKDIFGTYENYVVPVDEMKHEEELLNAFKRLMGQEAQIRNHLAEFMPEYIAKAREAVNELRAFTEI